MPVTNLKTQANLHVSSIYRKEESESRKSQQSPRDRLGIRLINKITIWVLFLRSSYMTH